MKQRLKAKRSLSIVISLHVVNQAVLLTSPDLSSAIHHSTISSCTTQHSVHSADAHTVTAFPWRCYDSDASRPPACTSCSSKISKGTRITRAVLNAMLSAAGRPTLMQVFLCRSQLSGKEHTGKTLRLHIDCDVPKTKSERRLDTCKRRPTSSLAASKSTRA
jgi:hypothetical protein